MKILPISNSKFDAIRDLRIYLNNKDGFDDNLIEIIINFGNKVITEIQSEDNFNRNSLVVGHVQSGKTINFISIIANAFNYDFDICFVLTSINTKLLNQTWKRINNIFNGYGNEEGISKYTIKRYGTSYIDNDDLINEINTNQNQMLTFVLMKNNLDKLKELFNENPKLLNKKILIIDDEGDVASWTKNYKEEIQLNSKTNESLLWLLKKLKNRYFVSITATPYVQLLIDQDELLFTKVYTLKPGKDYYGINEFIDEKNKLIKIIKNNTEIEINKSLEYSFLFFLISNIYRLFDIYKDNNYDVRKYFINTNYLFSEMIIHTSEEKKDHDFLNKKLSDIMLRTSNNITDIINYYNLNKNFNNLSKIQKEFIEIIKELIIENFDSKIEINDNYIYYLLVNIKNNNDEFVIHVINSDNTKKVDLCRPKKLTVYIGSKMIERGITFNNLLCSYFDNSSLNLDTFLQRNRWFGYRKNILKYMKLFINNELYEEIIIKSKSINKIFNELKRLNNNSLSLNKFDKNILPNKKETRITSKRKYYINNDQFIFYNNKVNNINADKFSNIIEQNFNFFYNDNGVIMHVGQYSYKSIKFNNINDFFEKFGINNTLLNDYFDKDYKLFEYKINNFKNLEVIVLYMLTQKGDIRNRVEYSGTIQLFQGSNINAEGELYWCNLPEFKNKVIIQIYPIKIRNTEKIISRIVFQLPKQ